MAYGPYQQYASDIDEFKKANPGWTDADAIGWGVKYRGWNDGSTPATAAGSVASAAPPYSAMGSSAPDPNRFVDGRALNPQEQAFWQGAMKDQYGIADFWGTVQDGTPVSGSPDKVWVKAGPNGSWASMTAADYQAYKQRQPVQFNVPDAPAFNAPTFTPPDPKQLASDPGYQWRLAQGLAGVDASAAARGTLRGGGHQKALVEYGQGFASNEYDKAFQKGLATYAANYTGAKDAYAPQLATWQAKTLADARANEVNFGRGFDAYMYATDNDYRKSADSMRFNYQDRALGQDESQFSRNLDWAMRSFLIGQGNA